MRETILAMRSAVEAKYEGQNNTLGSGFRVSLRDPGMTSGETCFHIAPSFRGGVAEPGIRSREQTGILTAVGRQSETKEQ